MECDPTLSPILRKEPISLREKKNTNRASVEETSRHNHTSTRKIESHATRREEEALCERRRTVRQEVRQ